MLMEGKSGIILNVANRHSIAWAIAQALHREGAHVALAYQNERLEKNVRELAGTLERSTVVGPCDVTDEGQIDQVFSILLDRFGTIDFLAHCIAFAKREELDGAYLDTSRDGYLIAQEISSYSLVALAQRAAPLMEERGGSIMALTYLGGEKVVPHYNVMGVAKAALESSIRYLAYDLGGKNIRVNGVSAGPLSTLAARGIAGFSDMRSKFKERAPLGRYTEHAEVADTALFLSSHLSRGITGEVIYVDCGYHIMGM